MLLSKLNIRMMTYWNVLIGGASHRQELNLIGDCSHSSEGSIISGDQGSEN